MSDFREGVGYGIVIMAFGLLCFGIVDYEPDQVKFGVIASCVGAVIAMPAGLVSDMRHWWRVRSRVRQLGRRTVA